jgi:hypothetical protein
VAALIAFFRFYRKSTILPVTAESPGGICRQDIHCLTRFSFELIVQHRKTIQFRQRVLVFHYFLDQRLCPIQALLRHLTLSPAPMTSHIFSYLHLCRLCQWKHTAIVAKFKVLLEVTSNNPNLFSAHSFHRGGGMFALSVDMVLLHVKMRGDWKSNCVERYSDISIDAAQESAWLLSLGAS